MGVLKLANPIKIYRHSCVRLEPTYSMGNIFFTFYAWESTRLFSARWDRVSTGCEIELPDGLVMELTADENILTSEGGGRIESFRPLHVQGRQRQWVSFKFRNKTINFPAYIEAGVALGRGSIKTEMREIEITDVD